jgi:hypothetical protein
MGWKAHATLLVATAAVGKVMVGAVDEHSPAAPTELFRISQLIRPFAPYSAT